MSIELSGNCEACKRGVPLLHMEDIDLSEDFEPCQYHGGFVHQGMPAILNDRVAAPSAKRGAKEK